MPLFKGLRYKLVVDSVLDGNTLGAVYAADSRRPSVALLWNRQDALLLAGDPNTGTFNAGLNRLLRERIVPAARGGSPHWHCWADNAASAHVAERVGFEFDFLYEVYRFPL